MYKETSSELSLVMVGLLCVCGGGPGKKVSSIPHWVVCVEKDAVPCVSWQVVSRLYRVGSTTRASTERAYRAFSKGFLIYIDV